MKLELLLQLEITIKAQLNKMYGYMIVKEIHMYFFEINLTSLTLCGRRIKACEEVVPRPSVVLSTSSHT